MYRRNRWALTLVVLSLLALALVTCGRFADNDTKAKLYGWLPGGAPPVDQGSTRRP